jgi:3-dehydroquinate synthase
MAKVREKNALKIECENKKGYTVNFIDGMFDEENEAFSDILRSLSGSDSPTVFLVADQNVVQKTQSIGTRIGRYFQKYAVRMAAAPVILSGGEKNKADGFQSVTTLISSMVDSKIGANDVVIALGGGALMDIAGYVASQVRGGVKLVRVPTTPAAMVDGAFSEMAAVDYQSVKDAVRVPCVPDCVVIDAGFAATVLDGVWRGGLGEIVRHAAVRDSALMRKFAKCVARLKDRDMEAYREILVAAVESRVKKGASPFALWSANRLESMSGYKLPHGYAVPIGVCIDCAYAVEKKYMKESDQELICRALADCGALDGLVHSHHLLSQADNILYGLDAWRLSTGSEALVLPAGVGKETVDGSPDRELFRKVIKEFLSASMESHE